MTAPEDDLPTTSLSELDDAMGAAVWLVLCLAVVVIVAVVAAVRWFGIAHG